MATSTYPSPPSHLNTTGNQYFALLHSMGVALFSSLQYYDRVVRDLVPTVFCATDREAHNLGTFLRETLSPLRRWRFDKEAYNREAYDKPGFATAIGSDSRCKYEQYAGVFYKWCVRRQTDRPLDRSLDRSLLWRLVCVCFTTPVRTKHATRHTHRRTGHA